MTHVAAYAGPLARLPIPMIELIQRQADRHFARAGTNAFNALIWTAIHEYLENIQ